MTSKGNTKMLKYLDWKNLELKNMEVDQVLQ